jgi:hypothetical protein
MKALFKFSVLLILLAGCQRDKADFIGPAYISVPAGFEVMSFTSSLASVDFTADSIKLNATFSSEVSWKLTITGQTSGAVYEASGIASGLNNFVWKGGNTGVTFFATGENAVATLSFYGTTMTSSLTLNVIKARNFTTYGRFLPFGDFENPLKINDANHWHGFNNPPIPNESQGVDSAAVDYNGNVVLPVQGKNYYFIKGVGNQPSFVSGVSYDRSPTALFSNTLPADADNVWVNIYIYGTGDANTAVDLEYKEADATGKTVGYGDKEDDSFVAHLTLNHKGWKLFSFKYSDLVPSTNAGFGDKGNKIHEPNNLMIFDLVLLKKSNPDAPVEVYFDYPIVTVGGPFNPSK